MALKAILAALLGVGAAPTGDGDVQVLPWNGARGAVSLTFDDGDPSQLSVALPELDRRKIRATFFLITSQLGSGGAWKKAAAAGHEMASHSATHRNPAQVKAGEEEAEVQGAARTLEQAFGRPVVSFAYPYSALTPELRARVAKSHLLARGGEGPLIGADREPDWLNLPSQATTTEGKLETYQGWIDEAENKGEWSIFMIHGLEGSGYTPIRRGIFVGILDHLKDKDLWVAPLGEVGAYARARQAVDQARAAEIPGGRRWEWKVPAMFPKGLVLKARCASPSQELCQKDAPLKPDPKGVCSFRFDEGSLVLRTRR